MAQVVLTVESVDERKKNAVSKLTILIKEWATDVYKDAASTSFVKRYNRFLQNRDVLKSLVVTTTNYEYLSKQLLPTEKELLKYFTKTGERRKHDS